MSASFPYPLLNSTSIINLMNEMGSAAQPFLFIVDFHAKSGYVIAKDKFDEKYIRFAFHDKSTKKQFENIPEWKITPVQQEAYAYKFAYVKQQIHLGNSFLTNLTQPTSISTNLNLEEIYQRSYAPYKLLLKDQFLVLSPETFVQIDKGIIKTFPMKGTIDASIPDAEAIILNDEKEMAEHATIVDLLRNDLSMVAENVHVTRYRYVEKIKTLQKDLLQVSSEISGVLPEDYLSHLGDILFKLLPAGSISGAPKSKTLEIIQKAEGYERGFYTGVCGYFDGEKLDSAVMIRFLEQTKDGLIYKSGGGITFQSEMEKEYEELIQKVYVPVY
jgi:para-aminobenzoate synthetase component I